MARCTSCGSSIPEGQGKSCSMCYGDINHGSDGYYRDWQNNKIDKMKKDNAKRKIIINDGK